MLRILTIFLSCAAFAAWGGQGSDERVKGSLTAMGYQDISLEGCRLSFSRTVVPTEENNEFSHYTRVIFLSTLGDATTAKIKRGVKDASVFDFIVPFNESYKAYEYSVLRVSLLLRRKYPNSNWPYDIPHSFGEFTPLIEEDLPSLLHELEGMNRAIVHSRYGTSTMPEMNFRMSFDSPKPLEEFLRLMMAYMGDFDCVSGQ